MANNRKEMLTSQDAVSESDAGDGLQPIATVDVDNYHGLSVRVILVYLSINLIAFAQILDLVGSSAYARDISAAVGGATETVWLSQSIGILTALLSPPVSQAADYWGRKVFIVVLTIVGAVGAIIVSRATSMGMAIAGQVLVGLSFGSQPLLYAVASEILPRKFRPAAQAGINVSIGLAGIFTLLVGSTVIKNYHEGFRIYFYIVAAIFAVSAVVCAVLYNPPPRELQRSLTLRQKLGQLDWIGYGLISTGLVLFGMALSWSDNPYSWSNPHIIAPFVVGIIFLAALAIHQTKFKRDGLFHHDLFKKDRNLAISLGCIMAEGAGFFAATNFFPFEVSVFVTLDPFQVSLRFVITFFAAMVASCCVGFYSMYTRRLREPIVLAFLLFTVFYILMATVSQTDPKAFWGYPVFLGAGLGLCLTSLATAAQLSAPPSLIAITSGLFIGIRSLGASIAFAIYTAIFNAKLSNLGNNIAANVLPLGLSPKVLPDFIGALAGNNQTALAGIPGVTPQIIGAGVAGLQHTYLLGFRYVWVCAGVLCFVAAIGACFIINPKADFTMHVDAPLEEDVSEDVPSEHGFVGGRGDVKA